MPKEVKEAGYDICPDELSSIVEGHDLKKVTGHGGAKGIADKLCTSAENGLTTDQTALERRQNIFGINKFAEPELRSFRVFVW